MSVEPLPSGRWRARWLTKEGIHAGKTFDTKEEAEAYDHALKAERKRLRRQRVYTGHTFNEVLYRHFERKIEAEKWTDESRRTFESSWRLIRADIGDVRVDQFSPRDAERLQARLLRKLRINAAQAHKLVTPDEARVMHEKALHGARGRWKFTADELDVIDEVRQMGYGVPMARKTMSLLGGALGTAELEEWVDRNVVSKIDKIPQKDYQVRDAMPPFVAEAVRRAFLEADDLESDTLVSTMQLAGLRPQEALALDRHRSFEEQQVKVFQALVSGRLRSTKTRRNRTVHMLQQLDVDVATWLSGRPGRLVFERDGAPWNGSRYSNWRELVYRPVVERVLGERIPPYELGRHVFIALLLAEGRPLAEVAREAGHSVAVLSEHYALVIPEFRSKPPVPATKAVAEARAMTDAELRMALTDWRKRRGTSEDGGLKSNTSTS